MSLTFESAAPHNRTAYRLCRARKIADRLGVPAEARPAEHFGGFARMAGADLAASSALSRAALDWTPVGPSLMRDLDEPGYYV